MKKYDIIKHAQIIAANKAAQIYPGQDYYLQPLNNEYGFDSPYPFPNELGVSCVFDNNGECIYIFKHSSWNNHFSSSKVSTLGSNWKNAKPYFIVPLILKGECDVGLSELADNLKRELIAIVHPCEN